MYNQYTFVKCKRLENSENQNVVRFHKRKKTMKSPNRCSILLEKFWDLQRLVPSRRKKLSQNRTFLVELAAGPKSSKFRPNWAIDDKTLDFGMVGAVE